MDEKVTELCLKILKKYSEEKILHSQRVLEICEQICKDFKSTNGYEVKTDLLFKAALLHDVAKAIDDDHHPELAAEILEEEWKHLNSNEQSLLGDDVEIEKIGEIIRCHKKEFDPESDVAIEAAILRMADKIDKIERKQNKKKKKREEAEKSYNKSKKKVLKYDNENMEEIVRICDLIKDTLITEAQM